MKVKIMEILMKCIGPVESKRAHTHLEPCVRVPDWSQSCSVVACLSAVSVEDV